jgi:hypothetical protein
MKLLLLESLLQVCLGKGDGALMMNVDKDNIHIEKIGTEVCLLRGQPQSH